VLHFYFYSEYRMDKVTEVKNSAHKYISYIVIKSINFRKKAGWMSEWENM